MISLAIKDSSQIADARRAAGNVARDVGFDEEGQGRVAIVVTELATNLVKHGSGGQILVGSFEQLGGEAGVELIAVDNGPGIADMGRAMADGNSTAGTAGNGLGAIKRQSCAFEIYSRVGQGTVIVARVSQRARHGAGCALPSWAAVNVAMPGETVSGDGWAVRSDGQASTLMVVDGLGHGPEAAKASTEAMRLFEKHWRLPPTETLGYIHAGLRATRGGAIAIARVDPGARSVTFAGVGNIAGSIIASDGQTKRMMSHNGTVGHNARRIQEIVYPLDDLLSMIILHSDGLSGSWSISNYPGLAAQHPSVWAAILYRDFARGRDDATVLVAKATAA
jgi:anti-sigma regulatory factor (Ser/Thr protein kinase)